MKVIYSFNKKTETFFFGLSIVGIYGRTFKMPDIRKNSQHLGCVDSF